MDFFYTQYLFLILVCTVCIIFLRNTPENRCKRLYRKLDVLSVTPLLYIKDKYDTSGTTSYLRTTVSKVSNNTEMRYDFHVRNAGKIKDIPSFVGTGMYTELKNPEAIFTPTELSIIQAIRIIAAQSTKNEYSGSVLIQVNSSLSVRVEFGTYPVIA